MIEFLEEITGLSFRPKAAKLLAQQLLEDQELVLLPEPDNRFDPFAVQIIEPLSEVHIGYVPRKISMVVAQALENGRKVVAHVSGRHYPPRVRIEISGEKAL